MYWFEGVVRFSLYLYLGNDDCFAALMELRMLLSLLETTVASSADVG